MNCTLSIALHYKVKCKAYFTMYIIESIQIIRLNVLNVRWDETTEWVIVSNYIK